MGKTQELNIAYLIIARFGSKVSQCLFTISEAQFVGITDNGDNKSEQLLCN